MRSTTVFLAIASLIAVTSAHPGHEHGPTTPSPCLTNPANATCATYNFDMDTLSKDIDAICSVSSFLPGCSLNTACKADATLPQTQCAPLTVLATLCTAAEDKDLTSAACAKSYDVYCGATSVIGACKNQTAFPGLPSGKLVSGAVYSICQEMPNMKDCKLCPAPDATGYSKCDEVKAWSGLCLDMPDMTQCPSFNSMCKNTTFAPFCTATYKAPNSNGTTGNNTGDHSGHGNHGGNGDKPNNSGLVLSSSLSMTAMLTFVVAGVSSLLL